MEFLYSLFSRFLDRKIEEVRGAKDIVGIGEMEDDIQDDAYLGIVAGVTAGNQPKLTARNTMRGLMRVIK